MKMEKKMIEKNGKPPKNMEEILIGGGKGQNHRSFQENGVMNLTPEQHQNYKRHSFDAYIKKTLKREAWRCYREIKFRLSREVSLEDLPDDAMEVLSITDFYPWEHCSFCVADAVIFIEDEKLALALERLPSQDRDIFLMHWFLDMADKEIASRMRIARRTVNDRRRKSYETLKRWMRGGQNE